MPSLGRLTSSHGWFVALPLQAQTGWWFSSTTPYRSSAKLPMVTVRRASTPGSSLVFSVTFKTRMSPPMPRTGWHLIELINDDQVNAWLRLSQCTTLTTACFLHWPAVVPPGGGVSVPPNTPLVGHYRKYLVPSQFAVAEFYTEAESSSDEENPDNIGGRPKSRKAFPKSDRGWQKRIQSNDRKVIRFQNQSRGLISRARLQQGEGYMG